jgi:hypothetical protein
MKTKLEVKAAHTRTVTRVRENVSFAEAFLRGGIANFVGTYWPVGDQAASTFGEIFYKRALDGETIGSAVMNGRKEIAKLKSIDWADYILYGDSNFILKKRAY